MNCGIARNLLQQSLDGTSIDSPEWQVHLHECADCRALASAGRRLQEGLRLLTAPLPSLELGARIAERVLWERRLARRRARRRWAVGLTLAAGLLLALFLRFERQTPSIRVPIAPAETMAKNATAPHLPSPAGDKEGGMREMAPTLRQSAAELGEVFATLTSHTADETVGQTRNWVSNVPRPALPKVEITTMDASPFPLREAGQGVSEGLEPVTNSARRAVGLFLRELPPMTTEPNGL
jgi:hypothetical protein